jgi:hypothetical protein
MEAKHTQGELKYASESIDPDWAVVTEQMPAEAIARRIAACWAAECMLRVFEAALVQSERG